MTKHAQRDVRSEIQQKVDTATAGRKPNAATMVEVSTLQEWVDALAAEWSERTRESTKDTATLVVKGDEVKQSEGTFDFLMNHPYDFNGWVASVEEKLTEVYANDLPGISDGTVVAELSVDFVSYTNERGDWDVTYEGRVALAFDEPDWTEEVEA